MHAISSYRGNRPTYTHTRTHTHKHTHKQTKAQTGVDYNTLRRVQCKELKTLNLKKLKRGILVATFRRANFQL